MQKILVTGCAGFIGFHVSRQLLQSGYQVLGFDNLNPFYNEGLKDARLAILRTQAGFEFVKGDLTSLGAVQSLFREHQLKAAVHLAAQPGVRYSLENPQPYVQSNLVGFVNLIDEVRRNGRCPFVFASSSSVYGASAKLPFSERDSADHPISLYAATKRSNELIGHAYAHLYGLPVTGLRFFTIYGPWGRPDMALFKFCKAIFEGTPIQVYNHGRMLRDFTYIDDAVEGVIRVMEKPPCASTNGDETGTASAPYRIYNIGNSQPVELVRLIRVLEDKIKKKAIIQWLPMQAGDVPVTCAETEELLRNVGYRPKTPIEEGVSRFVDWFREYYEKE
jgi:UDP-glucuronate 4-epimerase